MSEHLDRLSFMSPEEVIQVGHEFGTPTYVYDEVSLRSQASEALNMPVAFGDLTVRYAMKANPNPVVLDIFNQEGIKIDASSEYEVEAAASAGVNTTDIALTTQQFPANPNFFLDGVEFNACSLHQLSQYGALLPRSRVGVRFNPGLGSGHSAKTNVGGPSSSFGIWHEYTDQVSDIADSYGLTIDRIHTHIGSGSDPDVWTRVASMTLDLVELFPDVTTVDLGGGFKVARMRDEVATDLQVVGAAVKKSFENFAKRTGRELNLEIEPGTFLVANAGVIVSEIIDKCDTGEEGHEFIKVDSGMTENLRPSLYGAQHPLVVVSEKPNKRNNKYVVVGHNCESGDLLTPQPGIADAIDERLLQEASIGDKLVIEGSGAYCASMAARQYNSFPPAKEVLRTARGEYEDISQS